MVWLSFGRTRFLSRKKMGVSPAADAARLLLPWSKMLTAFGIRRALFEPGIDAVTVIQRQIEVVAVSDIVHTKMLTILTFANNHASALL